MKKKKKNLKQQDHKLKQPTKFSSSTVWKNNEIGGKKLLSEA